MTLNGRDSTGIETNVPRSGKVYSGTMQRLGMAGMNVCIIKYELILSSCDLNFELES